MLKKEKLPLGNVILFYLLFFWVNKVDWLSKDDGRFAKININPFDFSVMRYSTWSSRFWIEGMTVFMAKNKIIFMIVSLLLLGLMLYSVSNILKLNRFSENLLFATLFIILFPLDIMQSAGWIATIVNYLWPFSLFTYWLMIHLKTSSGQTNLIQKVIALFCLILSIFNEGIAIIGLCYLLLMFIIEKKAFINFYNILCSFFSLLSIINVLICPGNGIRRNAEIGHWFPQFEQYSLPSRLLIQFVHIGSDIISHYGSAINVLLILLLCISIAKKNFFAMTLSLLSTLLVLIVSPKLAFKMDVISNKVVVGQLTPTLIFGLIKPAIVLFVIVCLIVLTMIVLYGMTGKMLILVGSLAISFISGMSASLSPTLLASNSRPYIILFFVIVFSCAFLVNDLMKYSNNRNKINDGLGL